MVWYAEGILGSLAHCDGQMYDIPIGRDTDRPAVVWDGPCPRCVHIPLDHDLFSNPCVYVIIIREVFALSIESDESELERWIAQWSDKMLQMSYLITRDSMLAEEITQDAFFRLYQWQKAHPEEPVTVGWLYAVTKNLSRDALRLRKREPVQQVLDDNLPSSERFDAQLPTRIAVLSTIDSLSVRDRECLFLFYFADFSMAQIAEQLQISPETVRSRLYRARQRFLELWRGDQQ